MPPSSAHSPIPIAFWAERRPDGTYAVESFPERIPPNQRTPSDLPVLVNDLVALRSSGAVPTTLAPYMVDIRELFSFTHPVSGADEVPVMLGILQGDLRPRIGARELAASWPAIRTIFTDWPPLLAEAIVQILSASTPGWRAVAEAIAGVSRLSLEAPEASTTDSSEQLLNKVRPTYERPPKREIPDPSSATPLDPDEVAGILGPNGTCAALVPGYEHRPGQLQMTKAVTQAFNRSKHLVVEAGTGVGKSLAYLLPSILWARQNRLPVVISTNTKNLQTQLFEKDIPTLRGVLETPFTAALIKGRGNYVCLRRLQRILERREAEISDEEAVPFAKTLAWIARTATGDLDELDRVFADGGLAALSLKSRLYCPSEECGGRRCRFANRCLLQRARACSLTADIIVANHSLVFAESSDNQTVFPKYAHIVFDEAHNLEESATRHFTTEITPVRFRITLRRLWKKAKSGGTGSLADFRLALQTCSQNFPEGITETLFERADEAIYAADKVLTCAIAYFQALASVPKPGSSSVRFRAPDLSAPAWQLVRPKQDALEDALYKLSLKLTDILTLTRGEKEEGAAPDPLLNYASNPTSWEEATRSLSSSLLNVNELLNDLAFTAAGNDPDSVFWLSVHTDRAERRGSHELYGILQAAPIDISQKLADSIFNARESIILCSATLSISGSFTFLSQRIGLDKIEPGRLLTCQAASPFDYLHQCHTCVPSFLPEPNDVAYVRSFSSFLVRLFHRTRGRALVLFTSYEMMRKTAQEVAPKLASAGIQLLVQGTGGSRDRLTRIFRREISSVLFGTSSFWEGVDVIGESLSCVVLARLPFDSPGDPLLGARAERVAEEGGSSFFDYQLPCAIIRLRQGVGRLIRHRDDHGLVVIADNRIKNKGYGIKFCENIPGKVALYTSEEELYAAADPFLNPSEIPTP